MLRTYLLVAGVSVTALGLSLASGCSSNTAAGTGGAGGGAATGGGSSVGAGGHLEPPTPGPMKAGDGATSVTFAISKLYLGDTKRDGSPDKVNGWKDYGYDLDNKLSTASSTDLCKPRSNASPKNVYPDGTNGVDNSFGKNILPIILGIAADASTKVNESITKGAFTIMLDIEKLGTGTDYNPLLTRLYAGSALANPPKWDGTDMWPVVPELLTDPTDIKSAKVQFPMSYVTGDTWVSGSKGTVELSLSVSGFTLTLPIADAVISFKMDSAHKTASLGTIAGVLPTQTLIDQLKMVAGAFDPSLCSGPTIDSITTQIAQASDIMQDGSQDPSKQCDGISIGLGFDASVVVLGGIGDKAMPKTNPCDMDGGAGGAGGAGG